MNGYSADRLTAWTQALLAFIYFAGFMTMFATLVVFWDRLSKMDATLLGVFATAAMNQSKDAATYFFARHRPGADQSNGDDTSTSSPASSVLAK